MTRPDEFTSFDDYPRSSATQPRPATRHGRTTASRAKATLPRWASRSSAGGCSRRATAPTRRTSRSSASRSPRRKWPGQDPIGRFIQFGNMDGDLRGFRIVGIVGDVRELSPETLPGPIFYGYYQQRPTSRVSIVVKSGVAVGARRPRPGRSCGESIRKCPLQIRTVEDAFDRALAGRRFSLLLIGVFSACALVLATLGVYGLMAYLVSQRTREIGIRLALGAESTDVVALIVGRGVRLAVIGVAIGAVAALGLTRLLDGMLFGVTATDPIAFASVIALTLTAVLAGDLGARRDARCRSRRSWRCGPTDDRRTRPASQHGHRRRTTTTLVTRIRTSWPALRSCGASQYSGSAASLVAASARCLSGRPARGQVSTPPTTRDLLRDIARGDRRGLGGGDARRGGREGARHRHREIAVAGAVRIAASSERLVDRYRDVENLKRSAIVLDLGRFSTPPRPADLAVGAARGLQPGPQRVPAGRVPRPARRARDRALPPRGRLACGELARAFADRLARGPAGYAAAYSRDGRRALPTYANKPEPLSVPAELVAARRPLRFRRRVRSGFPTPICGSSVRGARTASTRCCTGAKRTSASGPVLRLSHQAIYRGLTPDAIVDRHQPDLRGPLSRRRPHADDGDRRVRRRRQARPSTWSRSAAPARDRSAACCASFVRSTVQNRSRDALRKILASTKTSLEQH